MTRWLCFAALVFGVLLAPGCGDDKAGSPAGNSAGEAGALGEGGAGAMLGGQSGVAGQGQLAGQAGERDAAGQGGLGGAASAAFKSRGSVEQAQVWGAAPDSKLELVDANGKVVQSGTTDDLGGLIFRNVSPGVGYVVRSAASADEVSAPIDVLSVDGSLPPAAFYAAARLEAGYNYITTRDGTTLAAFVTLPGPIADGPYPTVVVYSGRGPAKPSKPSANTPLCAMHPILCDRPNDASAVMAALMGYATVGVNLRGTGCSGGAYDYFEQLQLLDGYDVIETVAAQPWVYAHHVGMVGLSDAGTSQLFVAKTHPPSLAAILPMSLLGDTFSSAAPGGIYNPGFALDVATNVFDKAAPFGQGWERARVDAGDGVCDENQLLHLQKVDELQQLEAAPYYGPASSPLDPRTFTPDIDVPVFLAGAWQDESAGPFFAELLGSFSSAPVTRFTTYNGLAADALAPQVLVEWKTFLDLYVARQVPKVPAAFRADASDIFQALGQPPLVLPADRFANRATWAAAKAAYEAEAPLRAIFENGAGDSLNLGAAVGAQEARYDGWPPSESTPTRYYFRSDGSLQTTPPSDAGASSFTLDPAAGARGILAAGGDLADLLPAYAWREPAQGSSVVLITDPLPSDVVLYGSASVDLWLRSPVSDADIEATLTEVRSDGQEMYVQSGWLRASMRALAPSATELFPTHTFSKADEALLKPNVWTEVRVGLAGMSHVFRSGSRLRVLIDTPGDSRAEWRFALKPFAGSVAYDVGHSVAHPSSIVLPVIAGAIPTTPLPACPSLRGQPCRSYQAYTNTPAAP